MEAVIRMYLVLLLLLFATTVRADIALISDSVSPVAEKLRTLTAASMMEPVVLTTAREASENPGRYRAVVVMGSSALKDLSLPDSVPVVGIFLSRKDYLRNASSFTTGLFVEPPFARQARLGRAIYGSQSSFGALVADDHSAEVNGVISIPDVSLYSLDKYDSLNQALIRLLSEHQALIGVYDPALYSPDNIKNILITAYRHNRPLIGPSAAYLRAGALATTYSSIDDVVKRLSEILISGLSGTGWPPPDYNPYFRVGFNEQVGRSLNLILPKASYVERTLRRQEGLE